MTSINSTQEQEVTYLSGITASGTLASQSFWTWNEDDPATYDSGENFTAKFGAGIAGTGATITYSFDTASNWTAVERAAFSATAALWSAVANVTFTEAPGSARVLLTRGTDGNASGGQTSLQRLGITGTTSVGVALKGDIEIDSSVSGFGPIGSTLNDYGGYPYTTLIHEWGHVLGLGHSGPYDEGLVDASLYTSFDLDAWTVMSYNDGELYGDFSWGTSVAGNGLRYGNTPTTPMPLDIVAIQRMYGVAVTTPLSGGQIFGFHSNIGGEIGKFFDFTLDPKPVVTLWDKGLNNTLDLSGFNAGSTVDLHDGAFSSAASMRNNIAIAYGTRIDTAITGPGNDTITANDNSDFAMGGAGADSIIGGSGNDHLYGAAAVAVSGDGADSINGGSGGDYLQGNAGDDMLDGGAGSDRIQGGQGNDRIVGGTDNDSANGNLGNDTIDGNDGNDSLRGGQGSDSISGGTGNDQLLGDLGADSLAGGTGIDTLTGGGDGDLFSFAVGEALFASGGPTDVVTDFTAGTDHIHISFGIPVQVLHGAVYATLGEAASTAQLLFNAQGGGSKVAALQVGGDSYIFYDAGPSDPLEAFKLLGFANAAAITSADFA